MDFIGRQEFWNIGYPMLGAFVYIVIVIAGLSITYGIYKRFLLWRLGRRNADMGPWWPRIKRAASLVSVDLLGHRRFIRKDLYAGLMHFFLFWGAVILLVATTVSALEFNLKEYFSVVFPTSHYPHITSFIWDIFGGVFVTIGVSMAFYRRFVMKPARLNTFAEDITILSLILALVFTGFLVEGLRIGATELNIHSDLYNPDLAVWSPVGFLVAKGLLFIGFSAEVLETIHSFCWWIHAALVAWAFVYGAKNFNKLTHMLVSPVNIFLRSDRPLGALRPMGDFETLETFGAKDIEDLSWKQLLDFDSCTNCGRCQDQCPAWASGKILSPRKLIQDMRSYMDYRGAQYNVFGTRTKTDEPDKSMITDFVSEEALWSCTTCRACMEVCPVYIEHIDSIVDRRRYLVLEQGSIPDTAMAALQNIEQRGHPWKGTQEGRMDWADGIEVETMADSPEHEILLWVGCTPALNSQNQKTVRAMVSVLKVAGVKFKVLGDEEMCTGDPARRLGNEYLYQTLGQQNIETFNRYNVKKILTLCPHCFNTIKNEYPQLGGNFEVLHYTEFVNQLIKEKKIKPLRSLNETVSYHDSCYLGRHNKIYDDPREIAQSIPGIKLLEMDKCRDRGFCCGAGGGRMWMEEEGERVNRIRTDHFLDTQADVVSVSCPFCMQMFNEGIEAKGVQDTKQVKDLIELVHESIDKENTPEELATELIQDESAEE